MPKPKLPLDGGCRCGEVRIRVTAQPLLALACHCKGCQRMTASAYSLSAAIPSDGFEVIKGDPVPGGLKGEVQHFCCPSCMSWIFTRPPGMDWFVNVRATLLDDAGWFEPFVETCTQEMLPWAKTPARHSYPKFPPFEDFDGLIQGYAALEG